MMPRSVESIIVEIFELQEDELSDELTPEKVESWDSMNHLKLVTAIEKEYEIRLSMEEVQSMLSVMQVKNTVSKHHKTN